MRSENWRWLGWLAVVCAVCWWVSTWPTAKIKITFCDVGQGDTTVIRRGFQQIVIDGGKTSAEISGCLRRTLPWWDHTLELVIATHPDADHIGGLPWLFEQYQVQSFLSTGKAKATADSQAVAEAVQKEPGLKTISAQPGQSWYLGSDLKVTTIWPTAEWLSQAEEANDTSIISLIEVRGWSILLTGDLEEAGEKALLKHWRQPVDVLKVGHHGSQTSTSVDFLAMTRPTWAVISVGRQNTYGHPHPNVVSRLEEAGVQIWRTDQDGDITAIIQGGQLEWQSLRPR